MRKTAVVIIVLLMFASCASIRSTKPFTVDLDSSHYPAGSAEAQFEKLMGGSLKKGDISASYYPEEDAVCLEFRADTLYFSQFWSRDGRDAFIAALEQYKTDYAERNLVEKTSKTKKAYGQVKGYIAWSLMRILSEPARGVALINMGYTFKEGAPFFVLTQRSAEYKEPGTSRKTTSPVVLMYLTRAQAEELAILFSQDYLDKLDSSGGVDSESFRDILRKLFRSR